MASVIAARAVVGAVRSSGRVGTAIQHALAHSLSQLRHLSSESKGERSIVAPKGANPDLFRKQYERSQVVADEIRKKYPHYPLINKGGFFVARVDLRSHDEMIEHGCFGSKDDKVELYGGHSTNKGPVCFSIVREAALVFTNYLFTQNKVEDFTLYMGYVPQRTDEQTAIIMGERQIVAAPFYDLSKGVWASRKIEEYDGQQVVLGEARMLSEPAEVPTTDKDRQLLSKVLDGSTGDLRMAYANAAEFFGHNGKLPLKYPNQIGDQSEDYCPVFDFLDSADEGLEDKFNKMMRDIAAKNRGRGI